MASPIVRGQNFGSTELVTATKLQNIVDSASFKDFDGSTEVFNVSGSEDIGTCVLAGGLAVKTSTGQLQIKDNGVTLAKMATQADQTVLGNVSGGTAVPTAVPIVGGTGILINDDALGTSDTKGATQGNIKAYVDEYALTYSGATGTFNSTTSYADLNLSSVVGSNRAMVIMEVFDASGIANIFFRTKGSSVIYFSGGNNAGWGASATALNTTNGGGTIVVVTDSSGIIEHVVDVSRTGINYVIQAYQKLA
tara:strand:+ start:520 stop:1272 length:753 start_codon:yes stop_codon:yes gene_type:complete